MNNDTKMDFKREPLEDYYDIGTEIGRYVNMFLKPVLT